MRNNTTISKIMQEVIKEKEIKELCEKYKYEDKARKAKVSMVLQYQMSGAMEESASYRELEIDGRKNGLEKVDYSTLSKKGKEIPYRIALELLENTMAKANRSKRRKLTKEYSRFVRCFDTTRFVERNSKWKWANHQESCSEIKAHLSYCPETGLPDRFNIGEITVGDTEYLEEFCRNGGEADCTLADRGYFSIAKFCHLDDMGQDFIIRIRNNTNLVNPVPYDFKTDDKYTDILCTLGKDRNIPKKYKKRQFRIVSFMGANGELVTLCTNIFSMTADEIAKLYRMRWEIGCVNNFL